MLKKYLNIIILTLVWFLKRVLRLFSEIQKNQNFSTLFAFAANSLDAALKVLNIAIIFAYRSWLCRTNSTKKKVSKPTALFQWPLPRRLLNKSY